MSSNNGYHDDGIGPFDVDPNQNSQPEAPGRTPPLFPMTVQEFRTNRADFVAMFKRWAGGSSGKTTTDMAETLEYMADDFDQFKTAVIPDTTATCFPPKCDMIKHEVLQLIQKLKNSPKLTLEIEEIMAYIGSATGRLTLEGDTDDDAWNETLRFVRIHERNVWDMSEMGFTQEAEELRTRLWTVYTNVNFSMAGCRCFQCAMHWRG
ncbi:hypothetical protein PMG11_04822 [Penicillium brasilianum]|uniref:Uncharacterized protein n=1 Tax=Penicillium brasilianum TaxID=104259 RepID=A0A0F7VDZ4_PENBI|nr:hypothetical protein PMG11_04822 [Penicillium brasilianum]